MFGQYQSLVGTTINAFVEICIIVFVFYSRMFPLKERKYARCLKYTLALLTLLVRVVFFTSSPLLHSTLSFPCSCLRISSHSFQRRHYRQAPYNSCIHTLYSNSGTIILQFQNMFLINPLYLNDISYQLIYITTTRTILFWLCLTNANIVNRRFSHIPLYTGDNNNCSIGQCHHAQHSVLVNYLFHG